jgi:hypothetical protein
MPWPGLWGSEGFPSKRLPAVPGDDCATLGRIGMCGVAGALEALSVSHSGSSGRRGPNLTALSAQPAQHWVLGVGGICLNALVCMSVYA